MSINIDKIYIDKTVIRERVSHGYMGKSVS